MAPQALDLFERIAADATNNFDRPTSSNTTKHATRLNGTHDPKPYSTFIASQPITQQRIPYIPQPHSALIDPGTARANIAPSQESPNGTPGWSTEQADKTVLQQHIIYWNPSGSGIIYPWDIYTGCRNWGWHPLLCLLVVIIIAPAMSYPTLPKGKWLPSIWGEIYLERIHKCKHGSDSGSYDGCGRFRAQQFEDLFAFYDEGAKGGLDLYDLARAHKGQRLLADPFGWSASFFEWVALYLLIWPRDGIMRKEDVRASFDGSLFQRKADEYAARKGEKAK